MDPPHRKLAIDIALQQLKSKEQRFWSEGARNAIDLLGESGAEAQAAVPFLLQALESHPQDDMVFNLAWALWRIDPGQKATIVPLLQDLRVKQKAYRDSDLEWAAVGALWQIIPESRSELRPALFRMLAEWRDAPAARHASAEMKSLLPALTEIAGDPACKDVRPWAVMAIRSANRLDAERWPR
jgi:hypothetical protein